MDLIDTNEIRRMLMHRHISADTITFYRKNGGKADYLLDGGRILRLSKAPLNEQIKLRNVESVMRAPSIHSTGSFSCEDQILYFIIIDYLQGTDLWQIAPTLTDAQKIAIGAEIAAFLNELHQITDEMYDIGHYIPTIPRYKGSWKNGHSAYADILARELSGMELTAKSRLAVEKAYDYIKTNLDALNEQSGSRLLHNDFHPKNIIIDDEGNLSGIIDWECSQFGEADFELTNFFEWCVYPPDSGRQLDVMLRVIIENLNMPLSGDRLAKRMTIYQLEHELNQLIWNGSGQEAERMFRLDGWLNGHVASLIEKW